MVQILVTDWAFSMGANALLRMDIKKEIDRKGNILDVPITFLQTLPERMFEYMITTYSVAQRRKQQGESYFKKLNSNIGGETDKEKNNYKLYSDLINKNFKDSLDKVAKYFPQFAEETANITSSIKEAIKARDMEQLQISIAQALDILSKREVDEKLTLNIVKATILSSSGGQVSFLNVTKNALSFAEQRDVFRKDFIDPLLWELQLQQLIEEKNHEQAFRYIQDSDHPIAKEWKKAYKKAVTMEDFSFFESLPKCSAIDRQWGTMPYEEMMFMPLASTSLNDFRDGNIKNAPVISSLARLLLLLAPLGCNSYRKKIGRDEQFVFSFLYVEGDCEETFDKNRYFYEALSRNSIFSEALIYSHERLRKLENERQYVTLLIEWVTFSQMKKTLLEYRTVNESFIDILQGKRHERLKIEKIYNHDFREQFVQQALRNEDTKVLIMEELYRMLRENQLQAFNGLSIKMALTFREVLAKGGQVMTNDKTLTDRMYGRGQSIRKQMGSSAHSAGDNDDANHRATPEKKIATIAYRLLNAAKGGNRKEFFETVLRLHVVLGKPISKEFTSLLDRQMVKDHQFSTMALAFIAGLASEYKKTEEEGETNL